MKKLRHCEPYGPCRRRAYPDVGDQLGALVELARVLRDQGVVQLPAETLELLEQIDQVKSRHPKGGRR